MSCLNKVLSILCCLTCHVLSSSAQNNFRPPLDIKAELSGTFGELRLNHLHSGIDFRTGGISGLPVYAIDDGYVSRIQLNPYGFGRVVHITHLNGLVSVYAHLQEFNIQIEQFFRVNQYLNKATDLNLLPEKGQIPVKKGDIIGLSGNSGSSGGPHLHFEIRDQQTQKPKNPLAYIHVPDKQKPEIHRVLIYPADSISTVENRNTVFETDRLNQTKPIIFSGKVTLGVQASDYQFPGDIDKKGIYKIKIFTDSVLLFSLRFDIFSFDETRYANSVNDYGQMLNLKRKTYRCYCNPGNQLSLMQNKKNAYIHFNDSNKHRIKIEVYDYNGNNTSAFLWVKSVPGRNITANKEARGVRIDYQKQQQIDNDSFRLTIPAFALDEDIFFNYSIEKPADNSFSPVYIIGNKNIPLFKKCQLAIKLPPADSSLIQKIFIATIDEQNKIAAVGGLLNEGWIQAGIFNFGRYFLCIDTVKPVIAPKNFTNAKLSDSQKTIQLSVSDEQSGIKSYNGFINNKWLPFEFDPKTSTVCYFIDDSIGNEKLLPLKFIVTDKCDNIQTYEIQISR